MAAFKFYLAMAAASQAIVAICSAHTADPASELCSLNGVLSAGGSCTCDKPWTGTSCETIMFKPVTFPQGYGMSPNLTSWGGNAIYAEGKYHLYVSAMTNHCLLKTWGKNSRIEHGVSDTIEGPYKFVDVAINTWSHNSAPVTLKDGTYAIFHIGTGTGSPNGGENCTATHSDAQLPWETFQEYDEKSATVDGSTIHTSKSVAGPWEPLMTNTLGSCNNPAPWAHPNGTIYCLCGNSVKRSESVSGPWTTISSLSHSGGPAGNYEDPFLYTDARGNFHLLYHVYNTNENKYECKNSTVSAHAFSVDGFTWNISATQPYTTQVELTTGETITVATRERPKLWFDSNGQMTHLFNGVSSATACPPPNGPRTGCVDCKYNSWDYTLVQPLAV